MIIPIDSRRVPSHGEPLSHLCVCVMYAFEMEQESLRLMKGEALTLLSYRQNQYVRAIF